MGFSKCVLILSAFYLFAYAVTFTLSKIVHSVYDKQLRNALRNLEENSSNCTCYHPFIRYRGTLLHIKSKVLPLVVMFIIPIKRRIFA